MSMLEAMAALRELVLIAASSIAAVVALLGLRTWKKQLKGRTDYELARRLLKSAYAVRDALQIVRHLEFTRFRGRLTTWAVMPPLGWTGRTSSRS
jgi:hypothetical protein